MSRWTCSWQDHEAKWQQHEEDRLEDEHADVEALPGDLHLGQPLCTAHVTQPEEEGWRCLVEDFQKTCRGSFSAISKPIFASECSLGNS